QYFKNGSASAAPPVLGVFNQNRVPAGGVPNFALIDHNGNGHELYRNADARGIVIVAHCLQCPTLDRFAVNLGRLKHAYSSRGIRFFALNTTAADTRAAVQAQAGKLQVSIPIMMDHSQAVA